MNKGHKGGRFTKDLGMAITRLHTHTRKDVQPHLISNRKLTSKMRRHLLVYQAKAALQSQGGAVWGPGLTEAACPLPAGSGNGLSESRFGHLHCRETRRIHRLLLLFSSYCPTGNKTVKITQD